MKSAVTVSLVTEARGGPFVFWDGLADACQQASKLGFDAIEIFAPGPDVVDEAELKQLLADHELAVAAVGTGAGMVKHGLSLTDTDPAKRKQAIDFVRQMIDFGATYGAPAIIGSMQGKWGGELSRDAALSLLADALGELGPYAQSKGTVLIYEPLNRYETNLLTTMADAAAFLETLATDNIRLLADLFHMNIEEADIAQGVRDGGRHIGHIHFVDSNRQAAGRGHMTYRPIIKALRDIGYDGYLCAEAFPFPDSHGAAQQTIDSFRKFAS